MKVTVDIPDAAISPLAASYSEVSRAMIESLAAEGYRSGRLSSHTVGQMLGYESRWETQNFLAMHNAWPAQTVEEFDREMSDIASLRQS